MAQTVSLYFDNSVLDPIAAQGAGGRLKKLLKERRGVGFASIQNLIEFFRMDLDDQKRAQRIRTFLQVARARESDPVLYQDIRALVSQIQRHHPDWVNSKPNTVRIRKELNDAKIVWQRLKHDPEHRPPGFLRSRRWVRSVVGESMRRHRTRGPMSAPGSALSSAFEDVALDKEMRPLFDALPPPEGHWREHMGLAYWAALEVNDELGSNLKDWLGPHLLFQRVGAEPWMRFWLAELDAAAVPRMRVEGMTDYFQEKVDSGNAGDIEHSGYAVGRDYLLTADKNFYQVLVSVASQPNTRIARPLLIERSASNIVEEISRALGWNASHIGPRA
jgi:hypothetical protein